MPKKKLPPVDEFAIRIVGYDVRAASSFTAHELNPRVHGEKQLNIIQDSLNELGWVMPVLENIRTGKLLDGHARLDKALAKNPAVQVPVIQVDVSESEEALILQTLDQSAALATPDHAKMQLLFQRIQTSGAHITQFLQEIRDKMQQQTLVTQLNTHISGSQSDPPPTAAEANPAAGYRAFNLMLSLEQERTVRQALAKAKAAFSLESSSDAIYQIALEYLR